MLKLKSLTKYYGKKMAISNVSFEINDGEIFGLIGLPDAGKTTTVRTILEYLDKDRGAVDKDYSKEEIGYLPSEISLYQNLTVSDMIKHNNSFYKKDCMKYALELANKLNLNLKTKICDLTTNELKKTGLVLTLMHEPKLIILDELMKDVDLVTRREMENLILEEKKKGKAILYVSSSLVEAKKICDRIAIIKSGKIVEVISIADLKKYDFLVVTIYAKDIKKARLPLKNMQVREFSNDKIEFIYTGDINELISYLSNIQIDKMLIQESDLEDIFLHYFKEEYNDKTRA